MYKWFVFLLSAASLSACNSTTSLPTTLTLNQLSGNNQIASSGAAAPAPLVVQVVSVGGAAAGITVATSSDTRYCTVSPASVATDASGNASFSLTALSITGVACTTSFAIVGQPASRGALNYSTAIRPAQRTLSAGVVALPSASATVTDAGSLASSVNVSAASNLPTPDANHTYGVYLAKKDASGNVSAVTLLGTTASFPLSAAFTGPVNLASSSYNVIAVNLQASGTGKIANFENATLVTAFTPVASGTATVTISLSSDGLRIPAPFTLPANASAQASLTNPNLNLGVAGDGISLTWNALPINPSGWKYALYAGDASGATTRLSAFNSNGQSGNVNFSSPAPANGALPSSITDLKAQFTRVFITLEPISSGDGGYASGAAGAVIALDSGSSAWVFDAPLPVQQ